MLPYLKRLKKRAGVTFTVLMASTLLMAGVPAAAATPTQATSVQTTVVAANPAAIAPMGIKDALWRPLRVKNGGKVPFRACDSWVTGTSATKCPGKNQMVNPGKSSTYNDVDAIQVPKGYKLQVYNGVSGGVLAKEQWPNVTGCASATKYYKVQPRVGIPNTPDYRTFRIVKC